MTSTMDDVELRRDQSGPCGGFRFQVVPQLRVGLVHLERQRPWPTCINPETGRLWSQDMKDGILQLLSKTPFDVFLIELQENTKINSDQTIRRAVAKSKSSCVDVLLAVQPVISDGRLAPVLAQEWIHPVVFLSTPEEQTGEMISGNSLVGSHLMSASLRQLGFQVEFVYGNLDWALTEAKLLSSVRIAFAQRYLKHAKIGLIGYQAPGFQDFHPNPFTMRKTFGTLLHHFGMTEYVNEARTLDDQRVREEIFHFTDDLKLPLKTNQTGFGVDSSDDIEKSSRHYLTMKKLIENENLDGLAIRCWPELPSPEDQGGLDHWCYLALARLATEGFPIACEGDVDGALSCMIGKFLGCGAVYLSDWLEHEANTLTLWHGGMAPIQLSEPIGSSLGPCMSRHFNNRKIGCLDATIKIGIDVTVFRFWIMNDQYHLIAMEGQTIHPKRHLLGNNGLVRFNDSLDLRIKFDEWIQDGFPHHICVVQGRNASRIASLARHCDVKLIFISTL